MKDELLRHHLSPLAVKSISTIELKKDEPLIAELHTQFSNSELHIYKAEELADISVPNPLRKSEGSGQALMGWPKVLLSVPPITADC